MILKRLVLENYKQHDKIDQTFTGNVIGVVGNNGSGKSNLLGSMHFALAGEQPGFDRADLLKWGTASGRVELFFSHNGIDGHITRALDTSSASFTYGTAKYNGIAKVKDAILEHLGMDKDLLKQTIFVRQAEIDNILFTEPRARELAFQRLCGIGDAAKVNKQLGEIISKIGTPPNYDEQITEGTARHAQMLERVKELRATKTQLDAMRAKCPDSNDIQNQTVNLQTAKSEFGRLRTLNASLERYIQRVAEAETELNVLPTIALDLDKTNADIETMRRILTATERYNQVYAQWESVGKRLVALGNAPVKGNAPFTPEQLSDMEKKANELVAEFNAVRGNLRLYKGVFNAIADKMLAAGMTCPLCGHTIDDTGFLAKQIADLEQAERKFNPDKAQLDFKAAKSAVDTHNAEFHKLSLDYNVTVEALSKQYAESDKLMEAIKAESEIAKDVNTLKAAIERAISDCQLYLQSSARRTTLNAQIKADSSYIDDLNRDISVIKKTTDNYTEAAIDTRLEDMNKAMQEIRDIDTKLAQMSGMLVATESSVAELGKTLKDLEDRRANQNNYREAVDTLVRVRDWFHYSNGPHTLANNVLNSMTADVNGFLERFNAPFVVTPGDEALGFKYAMTDGSAMPATGYPDASHLSGGQKIQLAVSFRFASYCMFANKLGLLSLDEPTVYLDQKNVGNFCILVEKIRDVAQKMGLQVLIATHERSVLPFLDSVIDLNTIHDK